MCSHKHGVQPHDCKGGCQYQHTSYLHGEHTLQPSLPELAVLHYEYHVYLWWIVGY